MKEIINLILFLLITLLVYVVRSTNMDELYNAFRYDYNYDKDLNGWLKFHKVPATFKAAFQMCKAEGAMLASPLTAKLRDAMVKMQDGKDMCGLLTGVHATFSKGVFTSIDGFPLSKMPVEWAPYEPDGYESCTVLLENGTLAGVRCSDAYPYMCFKQKYNIIIISKNSTGSNAFCGTIDKGETLQEAGYSTYASGEPNNNTEHDGGSFCGGVFRNGLLDDIWCDEVNFPFICEMKPYSLIDDSCPPIHHR